MSEAHDMPFSKKISKRAAVSTETSEMIEKHNIFLLFYVFLK